MAIRTFLEYVQDRTGTAVDTLVPVTSRVTLGDGNELPPFMVSDDPNSQFYGSNKGLAVLIRAFKKGGNWGWSKDEKSGEDKPVKMGAKKLFLTGGAVRDHLLGKRPRNVELVTNASPDEVYKILKQNKFEFSPTGTPTGKLSFWVEKKGVRGRPHAFGVQVGHDRYELAVFTKRTVGPNGEESEPGTHADDASGRDFTINAMSLLLGNDNGPNKELNDFYGGLQHLMSGKINAVGDLGSKIKEDPVRAVRYARMLSRYGDPKKISDEDKDVLRNAGELLQNMDRTRLMDEFKRGLMHDDQDPRLYLRVFNHLGILPSLFPGMNLDTHLPKELRELGDKHAPIAWMVRHEPPEHVEAVLGKDWQPGDARKIAFLVKSLQRLDPNMDETSLDDLVQNYLQSGIPARKLKLWASRLGGKDEALVDAFLQHAAGPRVRVYTHEPGMQPQVAEAFADLASPFDGSFDSGAVESRRRKVEWERFRSHVTGQS